MTLAKTTILTGLPVARFEEIRACYRTDKAMMRATGLSRHEITTYRSRHKIGLYGRNAALLGIGRSYKPGRPMTELQITDLYDDRTYDDEPSAVVAGRGGTLPVVTQAVALPSAFTPEPYEIDTLAPCSHEDLHTRLLAALTRLAENGERVPLVDQLAREIGVQQHRITVALRALQDEGLIKVWGTRTRRSNHGVIICATGARTT